MNICIVEMMELKENKKTMFIFIRNGDQREKQLPF